MTIQYYVGGKIVGLSSDVKPTDVPTNTTFIESDTFVEFIFDGVATWNPLVAPPIVFPELKAYYIFDNAVGNLTNESANTGSLDSNGVDLVNFGVTQDVPGLINRAYNYSGATDISLESAPSTEFQFTYGSDASFTMVAWFQQNSATEVDQSILLDSSAGGSGLGSQMQVNGADGSRKLRFRYNNGSTTETQDMTAGDFPSDTNWHFCVIRATLNGGPLNMTIDTLTRSFTTIQNGADGTSFTGFACGGGDFATRISCKGLMDEVSLWNRILTDQEVSDLYNGGAGLSLL